MKKIFFLLSLFLLSNASYAEISSTNINQLLNERINKNYQVGLVVAIIDHNGTKFYSAGHISKQSNAKPITPFTLFPIASVTKVFTTLLLADAILHKYLRLNDPVQKYFPNVIIPTFKNKSITLKHLATHTSGLPSQFSVLNDADPYRNFTSQKLYAFLNSYALTRPPGHQFEYADINIGILGDILEKVEHKNIASLIDILITHPLAMTHTTMVISPDESQLKIIGYNARDKVTIPYHFPILSAAGALYSTASDLAKFVAANMGIKKTELAKAISLTHIPYYKEDSAIDLDYPGIETLYIGLGWNIDKRYHLVWKNGNFPGYSCFIGFNTQKKVGIVVLANSGNIVYVDNLAMHLLNPEIPLFPLYQAITIPFEILKAYTGTYQMTDGTYYLFSQENNHLKVTHKTAHHASYFNIYPKSKTQFFGRISDTIFTFKGVKENIYLIIVEQGTQLQGIKLKPDL